MHGNGYGKPLGDVRDGETGVERQTLDTATNLD
jgi:hypothetical protein